MTILMNDSHIASISQIKELLKIGSQIQFRGQNKKETYEWIGTTLARFKYFSLKKKDKTIIKRYLMEMSGLSDAQIGRIVKRKKETGYVEIYSRGRHKFSKIYTPEDIGLLIKTDEVHNHLSGKAVKKIFERERVIFQKTGYERLKNISVSHIYNLRKTRQYQSKAKFYQKTKPVKINIGERKKPHPNGQPGYLRIDTIHQGDLDKEKGVYHINMVDEITQWEIVGCVEKISEQYLAPLLENLINQFPFRIIGFHSDNGSEFINKVAANLLNKLLIKQTKSRSRHCNDNALIEGKNGSIVRKYMGYRHIPKRYAEGINQFYKEYFNIYLNYHRPCGFATTTTDKKGKQRKIYNQYETPYEKLKSINNVSQYLKSGITFEILDKIAYQKSDNEFAALMLKAKDQLFENFSRHKLQFPTIYSTSISGSYVD